MSVCLCGSHGVALASVDLSYDDECVARVHASLSARVGAGINTCPSLALGHRGDNSIFSGQRKLTRLHGLGHGSKQSSDGLLPGGGWVTATFLRYISMQDMGESISEAKQRPPGIVIPNYYTSPI